jgi:hypothetical protein
MRVYDIIALNEELDVKPGVLGSDGKPVSWQVVDNQTGRVAQTFSGPDADGKAEEFRDAENARRKGGKPADSKADPNAKTDPKEKVPKKSSTVGRVAQAAAQTTVGKAVKYSFKGLMVFGRAIGFSQLPGYIDTYQGIQANIYYKHEQAIKSGVDKTVARDQFDAESRAAFGQWVANSAIVPNAVALIVAGAKSGTKFVAKVRAANAASTAATALTGPGILVGIVKWVLVEGAIQAVSWALSREAVATAVFNYFLKSSHDEMMEMLYESADFGERVGSLLGLASDKDNNAALRDVQTAMKMSPMGMAADQATGNQVNVKAAPRADAPASGLSGNVPD